MSDRLVDAILRPRAWSRPVVATLCILVGASVSKSLGQDANWDLLNYHLYNGFAFLHGRFSRDLLAAGMQSYLNPLLDALYAGLALGPLHNTPRVLAAVMGVWYGLAIYLTIELAKVIYLSTEEVRASRLTVLTAAAAAILLAATGSALISQVGTTTDEVQVCVLMLGGLLALVSGGAPGSRSALTTHSLYRRAALAGLLFGLAAGLKLTAAAYAPAAFLATLSMRRPRVSAQSLATGILFLCLWGIGFAVSDGWWAVILERRFGSPTFPMFNEVFRSPIYPPASVIDERFLPHDLGQWLLYPWYWAVRATALVNEQPFRDARFALTLTTGIAVLLARPVRILLSRWTGRRLARPTQLAVPQVQRTLLTFLVAGYVAWLATSSILRYAIVLEVVAGLMAPALLGLLFRGRMLLGVVVGLTALTIVTTRYPLTFRVAYGHQALQAAPPESFDQIGPQTLVVLTFRGPVSYLVAMLPNQAGIHVIDVDHTVLDARGWGLHDNILRLIQDHVGPIVVITDGNPLGEYPELEEVGMSPLLSNCHSVWSTFKPKGVSDTNVCNGRRMTVPALDSPFWATASTRYRTVVQVGDGSQRLIGLGYLGAAGPSARGTRFIDWTDLLWSKVGSRHDLLPPAIDSNALYVLPPSLALAAVELSNPATDILTSVDGFLVLAPGWLGCKACGIPLTPAKLSDFVSVLRFGATREMGSHAESTGYLTRGWWPQEPDGIWSTDQPELIVPIDANASDEGMLRLDGAVFTGPGLASQNVRIKVFGSSEPISQQTIAGAGSIDVSFKTKWLKRDAQGNYLLHIRLEFPAAESPAALGISSDQRSLGFRLNGIRLVETGPSAERNGSHL